MVTDPDPSTGPPGPGALMPEAFTGGGGTFDPRHEDFCP
jgi:hypothetical protein